MAVPDKQPGVSRENRISDEGLKRLERQLQRGARISETVKAQWVRRYGQAACEMFSQYEVEDPNDEQT